MENEPFFIDPELSSKLNLYIIRAIENPERWHPYLAPIQKLTYVYGLEGSKLIEQVLVYFTELNIETLPWDGLSPPETSTSKIHRILVVNLSNTLLKDNIDLTEFLGENDFVIVIGFLHYSESIPFLSRFSQHILVSPLQASEAVEIFRFRCALFQQHSRENGGQLDLILSETDWEWFESCCVHVTYADVYLFCQRLFYYCIQHEESTIDFQLLNDLDNKIMYSPHGNGIRCITRHDPVQRFKELCQKSGINYDDLPSLKGKNEGLEEDPFLSQIAGEAGDLGEEEEEPVKKKARISPF